MVSAYLLPMQRRDGPDRLTLAAFSGAVLIGGSNFVAVKFSNAELAPMYGAAVRFTAAAAIFLLLGWALSLPLPRGRAMLGCAVYGALGFGVAYGMMYFALTEVSIGTAAVITATVPLFTLVLAVVHGQERFTARGIVAGLLAVAGIGVISLHSLNADAPLLHLLAVVVATAAIAESTVVVKGFPRADPVTTNAVGMMAGALLLWMASLVAGESWILPDQARTWAAFGWLVIAGSVGLFYLVLFLIGAVDRVGIGVRADLDAGGRGRAGGAAGWRTDHFRGHRRYRPRTASRVRRRHPATAQRGCTLGRSSLIARSVRIHSGPAS